MGKSFGEAEVEHFHAAFGGEVHVVGLEIAVYDDALVGILDGID